MSQTVRLWEVGFVGHDSSGSHRGRQRLPNDRLRLARVRLLSPSGSGREMSRAELADEVNKHLDRPRLDDKSIGALERGRYRWPNEDTRAALRAVLGAQTDADLGLHITRAQPSAVVAVPSPWRTTSVGPDRDPGRAMIDPAVNPATTPGAMDNSDPARWLAVAPSAAETLDVVADLSGWDMNRRDIVGGAGLGFVAAAFAQPALYALTMPVEVAGATGSGRRVGRSDVEALRETVHYFRRLDQSHGGASLRRHLVRMLNAEVTDARHASFADAVGRQLFSAVAELACLAGYMTMDSGRHQLAQRYYVQALSLSRHAGDVALSAHVLGSMSFQATYLGHGRDGVALATAAQMTASSHTPPRARAMLKALEARGHALLGDERASTTALTDAEKHLRGSTPGEGPGWLAYFTDAELAAHSANCLRDLGKPARGVEPLVSAALDGYDAACVRSRGFLHTVLATAHLAESRTDVEAACGEADKALAIAATIQSVRAWRHLEGFVHQLRPHDDQPVAREFIERASTALERALRG